MLRYAISLVFAGAVLASYAETCQAGEVPNQGKVSAAGGKAAMRQRCLAAITASGEPAAPKPSAENAYDAGPGNYLFEFKQPDGGSFFCQICDDLDDRTQCLSLGLTLSHRPAQGEQRQLPAELDRKCVTYLQKELGPTGSMEINKSLVERIKVTPSHTDARYVFRMDLSMDEYRCVIRKSDGNFLVERHTGAEWRPIAAGVMF
jgi:hypothetical protein